MRQLQDIVRERQAVQTIVELTSVFESIASMRIAQIKNQTLASQSFFKDLWHIYTQLRVDPEFRAGRGYSAPKPLDKELFIAITAEGSFSGDIDHNLIELLLKNFNKDLHDIIVIGHHGAVQLAQKGVQFKKYFKLPERDQNINVLPLLHEVQQYKSTTVYYQTYVSLMVQDVKRIPLLTAVQEQGKSAGEAEEIISEANYIFEPTTYAVVEHLERSMLQLALGQVILESKLAQFASRFKAMSSAHTKAEDSLLGATQQFNRAKRALKDERLREIMNGLKKASVL